ncbi:MAG: transposase [Saprospirales bacterium]|nr:transposase [Saprospirales bacterium]
MQYRIQQFRTPACATCSARSKCTKSKNGRLIERTEYQDAVDRNDARVKTNWSYYRKRQELVEHPYGTIKRQWGFTYTLLKTLPKVQAESDLIFTCYNLKRCVNLLGLQEILERLKAVLSLILGNLRHLKKSQESIFTSFAFLSFFGGNIRREDVF